MGYEADSYQQPQVAAQLPASLQPFVRRRAIALAQMTTIVSVVSIASIAILAILLVFFLLRMKRAGAKHVSLLEEIKEGPRNGN
jgi:hypothetical protein